MSEGHKPSENFKRFAIGSSVAAVAGYVAGVMSAPKSGKQTRQDLKAKSDKGKIEAEKELKKLHTELNDLIKEAKKHGSKASEKAQIETKDLTLKALDTKEKLREIISAIHEGDAEDHDLDKAVKNASNAIDHLKDYLKK